jgi:hypothetical protein
LNFSHQGQPGISYLHYNLRPSQIAFFICQELAIVICLILLA